MIVIKEIADLEIEVEYEVRKYKQVYGSCRLSFIVQVLKNNSDRMYICIRDGVLFDYLKNKTDDYRFIIKRTSEESNEPYIVIGNVGRWINLRSY